MSADLFAEFNILSNTPPSTQQQPTPSKSQTPFQPQYQRQSQQVAKDPFDFFNSSNASATVSTPASAWPSFQSQPVATNNWGNLTPDPQTSMVPQAVDEDEDDGWGDFEDAQPTKPSPAPPPYPASLGPASNNPSSIAWEAPKTTPFSEPLSTTAQDIPARNRIIRASTLDLMSNNLVDIANVPAQPSQNLWGQYPERRTMQKTKPNSTPKDPNVLFDAEEFELQDGEDGDEDEFGDFETVSHVPAPPKPAPHRAPSTLPSMDLLSLEDHSQSRIQASFQKQPPSQLLGALSFGAPASNYPQAPRSPSFQARNPFPDLAIKTPTQNKSKGTPKTATPNTAWPTFDDIIGSKSDIPKTAAKTSEENDDEWAAWDDFSAKENKQTDNDSTKPPESWDWDAVDNVQPKADPEPQVDVPPPTNVPPPSIILSIFPDLLNSGNSLFKPMSGQTASMKQQILSNPQAVSFLQGYILLAVTAARVIAGRKQRWHRDKILAKSMSISAAGSKGMKLAGVDKTQAVREDREAADVVAVWRQHVGRLRSAVAAANSMGQVTLKVPELNENMHIQTAKLVPTAPKPCLICGLKRDERVSKVDFDVEDSFGEWWMDHWGHRACRNFWIEHEKNLRQR